MIGNKSNEIKHFFLIWFGLAFVLFVRFFDASVNKINTTMFSFSYKYGFISRGFIGSIYQVINKILPFDIMNYRCLFYFTFFITIIFYLLLAVFFYFCIKKCSLDMRNTMFYLVVFYTIFAIPMFCNEENFGRLDIYCLMLSLIAALLIIHQKAEWLVIPLSMMGVMIHQGNVFMYLNIILVLLLYRAFSSDLKVRKKYLVLFALSFCSASILFIWFEFLSHFDGENIYAEIFSMAQQLGNNGQVHEDVIDHEILGIDLTSREVMWHRINMQQFPIYLIITSPYIYLGVRFIRGVWHELNTGWDKLKYFIIAAGALTIIPDFLLKVDYGRWVFAVISYYCVVIIALLAMKDSVFSKQLQETMTTLKKNPVRFVSPLILAILLQPLGDVSIGPLVSTITKFIMNLLDIS